MAYLWSTGANDWWEDEESGQFTLHSLNGRMGSRTGLKIGYSNLQPALNRYADMAQLLGAALPGACAHSHIYPQGFTFCPTCGVPLDTRPAQAAKPLPAWWDATSASPPSNFPLPKYVPHGLPVTALPLAQVLETRPAEPAVGKADVRMPKPPNVPCVFAAANFGFKAQRLLALAYTRDVLQYWDPLAATWQIINADQYAADLKFSRSSYAWLPATSNRLGDVGIVPADSGLYQLSFDPVAETYATDLMFEAPLTGAPGAVLKHIACLYIDDDGQIGLWNAKADGSEAELRLAGMLPHAGWSAPFSYDGKLIWLHADGQLSWEAGTAPVWLAWPQGWAPRLNFGGPVQSRDGRLWLIGHTGSGYAFLELGRENGQMERIDGARLGFNKLLFRRGHQIKGDPWDAEEIDDQNKTDALIYPLLENFNAARSEPAGLVLRFDQYTGKAEAALDGASIGGRTYVEWIGQRNVILDEIIGMNGPADCVVFVYDDHLWLHHPKWNDIRGWHLKAMS